MRFKFRNLIVGLALYLYVAFVIADASVAALIAFLIYVAVCIAVTNTWIRDSERRRISKALEFSQSNALEMIGIPWGSFHHVFYSNQPVLERFNSALSSALSEKLGYSALEGLSLTDVDRDLPAPESRTFQRSTGPKTSHDSGFEIICSLSKSKEVLGVRWWILVTGHRDPNKLFWRYAVSPLIVPFVAISYFRRQYDPLHGLFSVHPGFFESVDVLSKTRELQFVAFETLVETLESFGIDTSDLKQQKGNILNINVSGGQTSFGSVVQGAFNKVSAAAAGGSKR